MKFTQEISYSSLYSGKWINTTSKYLLLQLQDKLSCKTVLASSQPNKDTCLASCRESLVSDFSSDSCQTGVVFLKRWYFERKNGDTGQIQVLNKTEKEEAVDMVNARGAVEDYGGQQRQNSLLPIWSHFDSSIIHTPAHSRYR